MIEKVDFFQKLKSRLPQIEKESLFRKLVDTGREVSLIIEACDNLEEGIILTDNAGIPYFFNRQADLWLGLQKRNAAKLPLWKLVADNSLARFLQENLIHPSTRTVHDFKLLSPREIQFRLRLIPYEVHGVYSTILILSDITTQTEQEFEAAMLAKMESLIRLAGGIAHEIGNPLNAITIHLELLKKQLKGISTPKQKLLEASVTEIQDETRRLDKIIKNFLKATRKPPLRFQLQDLNEVVFDAVTFLKPQLEVHGIRIKFIRDPGNPRFLLDRERLYYAFMNLIKNGMEAMPKGGLLTITVTHKEQCAVVAIADQGHGIPEEDLPRIFDIYYTTKKEGSGLGLMMVYDAVAEHGGKIEVSSRIKKGTTFRVLLPMREPQLQLPGYILKGEERSNA